MKTDIKKIAGVLILIVGIFITIAATIQPENREAPTNIRNYNLHKPDKKYTLPPELNEISGLTDVDATTIACVQDEKGIIYIYSLLKEEITNRYEIYDDGDFEGITLTGETAYMLRSDGKLLKIDNYNKEKPQVTLLKIQVPAGNNEGLCYDKKRNRLLIASKSQPENTDKNTRAVYEFDLKTQKLNYKPVLLFDEEIVLKQVKNKSSKLNSFKPSSLAVHPETDEIYIISASDPMVAVFKHDGTLSHTFVLDKQVHKQPEGITFLPSGEMLISNEGKGQDPVIYRFKFLK